jgi:molybdopterin-guanine dinucleotide biosynthesis protein A
MTARTERARMGFVLAGGKSSRMGADKAFLEFRGQTLLDRALAVMGTVSEEVAIVGEPAKFAKYVAAEGRASGYRASECRTSECRSVVADIFSGCGPLAGIHAALAHSTAELNLMLAVDMPFVSSELLAFLFAVAEDEDNGAIVTVPRASQRLQPLCAVYRRDYAMAAEQALRAEKYKVDAAFSGVAVRVIEESEQAAAGFSERIFFNFNTPEDCLTVES